MRPMLHLPRCPRNRACRASGLLAGTVGAATAPGACTMMVDVSWFQVLPQARLPPKIKVRRPRCVHGSVRPGIRVPAEASGS